MDPAKAISTAQRVANAVVSYARYLRMTVWASRSRRALSHPWLAGWQATDRPTLRLHALHAGCAAAFALRSRRAYVSWVRLVVRHARAGAGHRSNRRPVPRRPVCLPAEHRLTSWRPSRSYDAVWQRSRGASSGEVAERAPTSGAGSRSSCRPSSSWRWLQRSHASAGPGRNSEAVFRQAMPSIQTNVLARFALARCSTKRASARRTEQQLRPCCAITPDDVDARSRLAILSPEARNEKAVRHSALRPPCADNAEMRYNSARAHPDRRGWRGCRRIRGGAAAFAVARRGAARARSRASARGSTVRRAGPGIGSRADTRARSWSVVARASH